MSGLDVRLANTGMRAGHRYEDVRELTELLTQVQTGNVHVPSVHNPAVCGHEPPNHGQMPSFLFHIT